MTPDEYLARLDALVAAGCHREALDYSAHAWQLIDPPLTIEQREGASGLLEIAATVVSLEEAASPPPDRQTA